jgi:hypothetical protein
MAIGYPDYFSTPVHSEPGDFMVEPWGGTNIPAGTTVIVYTLSTRAIITGGGIGFAGIAVGGEPIIDLEIDDAAMISERPGDLLDIVSIVHPWFPMYTIHYDPDSRKYVVGLRGELTFRYKYRISIENNTLADFSAAGVVHYTRIW